MNEKALTVVGLLRQQSWLSPAFPTGAYGYSHGLEWAVEAGQVHDRDSLVDWLEADLCHGSGRNEAIFFREAWGRGIDGDRSGLLALSELAAAFRGTSELALESSQQGTSCLATLRRVWPDSMLDWLSETLSGCGVSPALAVVLGLHAGRQGLPSALALAAFLQAHVANLVNAGVRLIPLGQTDGQLAISTLETALVAVGVRSETATVEDLGSAAFMVDLSSMAHEAQYTRLFRS